MAAALASSRCCCRSSPPLAGRGRRSVAWCALSDEKGNSFSWKECAISAALSVGLITGTPTLGWSAHASPLEHVLPDVSVLISGPPIKDPGALLRYDLPIDNKAIREVQKPLEDITDSLKVAGVRALDSVGRVIHAFEVPGSTEFLRFPWLTFKAMRTKLTERSDFVQRMYKERMFLL